MGNKKEKLISIWNDRFWGLFMLTVGVVITITTTHYFNYVQYRNEKKSIIIVIEKEVQHHVEFLNNFEKAMENIKAGIFPEIGKQDVTLDRAMEKGTTETVSGFGLSHKSPVIESLLPNLKMLPPEIIEGVLSFYTSLQICELNKLQCEQALNERLGKIVEKPAPTCDVYLSVVKNAISTGDSLLTKLSKYNK